jgi:hypothetical protein
MFIFFMYFFFLNSQNRLYFMEMCNKFYEHSTVVYITHLAAFNAISIFYLTRLQCKVAATQQVYLAFNVMQHSCLWHATNNFTDMLRNDFDRNVSRNKSKY